MANLFLSGTDGRVRVGGGIVAGITQWTLEGTTSIIKIPHFESPVDAFSRVWQNKLFGLSDGQGTLEGYFDIGDDPSDSIITNGVQVELGLILFKGTNYGFGVDAVIGNFNTQDAVENQPAKFTCNYEVQGIIPLSAIVV